MLNRLAEWFNPGPFFGWLCLACLMLTPMVAVRSYWARRRTSVRMSSFRLLPSVAPTMAQRLRALPVLLRTGAILALLVALARPQSGGEYRDTREGIAIQMVMDVSGSMAEEDFLIDGRPARRLDATKAVFKQFVSGGKSSHTRENDLIGMTTFAMFAETVCPLTLDHGSLLDLLEETEIPGWVKGRQVRELQDAGFTSLGEAVVFATDDLRRAGEQAVAGVPGAEPAKSRVMILLTDGKDNPPKSPSSPSPNPIEAARIAATLGIKIYTIGAVGANRQSQSGFGAFFRPQAEVDEPMLQEIAKVTGGRYFRANDLKSLEKVYEEIGAMETRRTGERSFRDNVYAARTAMFAGLGFLVVELLLVNTRFRKAP